MTAGVVKRRSKAEGARGEIDYQQCAALVWASDLRNARQSPTPLTSIIGQLVVSHRFGQAGYSPGGPS